MRIDSINLIGGFYIKGLTPSSGQAIGLSGSEITWVTINTSVGGITGPQGVTGPDFINNQLDPYQIAVGSNNCMGLTSSPLFSFTGNKVNCCNNLFLGGYNSEIIFSTFSVIFMGVSSSIFASDNSILSSTCCSSMYNSNGGSIIGGRCNVMFLSNYSSILGGCKNKILNSIVIGLEKYELPVNYGFIGGGCCNYIQSGDFSAIIGGFKNNIKVTGFSSTIISGQCNKIIGLEPESPTSPAISGGDNNVILGGSNNILSGYNSVILAGSNNNITVGVTNSVIIGSHDITLCNSSQVAVLGSSGLTVSNFTDTTFVTDFIVKSHFRFCARRPDVCNGDLWFDSITNRLLFKKNDALYYVDWR
jgi:hypothetical protein